MMLTAVVSKLTELDKMIPTVRALALRHVDYGVKEEHYVTVGSALLYGRVETTGHFHAWHGGPRRAARQPGPAQRRTRPTHGS